MRFRRIRTAVLGLTLAAVALVAVASPFDFPTAKVGPVDFPTHVTKAHAFAACWWSDQVGVAYTDWYHSTSQTIRDVWTDPATYRAIGTDIQAYRYSGYDGNCYRGYYVSVWTGDGSGCNCQAHLRLWTQAGNVPPAAEFDSGWGWGTRAQVITPSWSGDLTAYVTLPSGQGAEMGFYRSYTNPRADNYTSNACTPTWIPCTWSQPGSPFWVSF